MQRTQDAIPQDAVQQGVALRSRLTVERSTDSEAAGTVETVPLTSGRRVAVRTLSAEAGSRTVVFCHPAPGSGAFDPDPSETAGRDVNLLAIDRPGYGLSEPVVAGEWASVYSAAADIAEVLMRRTPALTAPVGVVGWSAGGRVALALAARHPELVDRVVVVGTPAPHEAVPWIPAEHAAGLEALEGLPVEQVHALLGEMLAGAVPDDPASEEALAIVGAGVADAQALASPGVKARLAGMLREAFRQGAAGMAADIAGFSLQPWGFEPGEVHAKTLLLYGASDPVAGHRHASWWHARLPNARVEMVPAAGHMLLIPMWRRVLSHLAPGSSKSRLRAL